MTLTHGEIAYTYDALGNKWFKYVGEWNGQAGDEKHGTAYLFGFQYSFKYNEVVKYDWKLMHIATSEGYVSAVYPQGIGGNFKLHYVYNHTDHLGNIRQNITRKGNEIDILKEDNYYPFGLTHRGYNEQKEELKYDPEQDRIFTIQTQASRYRYQYNGKEWQEDVGVNWYDYGARNYDAAVGRWFNVDPLADFKPDQTPYRYGFNNPIIHIDPNGLYEIGKIKLTKSERKKLRKEYGRGKKYREAKRKLIEEKKKSLISTISDIKDFLDSHPKISKIFQDFTGIKAGTKAWDNLWTYNHQGPTINVSDMKPKAFTLGNSIFLSANNNKAENMATVLHEYVHYGDNMRKNHYDGTINGHPAYDAQVQRSAIEDVMRYTISKGIYSKEAWISYYGPHSKNNYHILDANGHAVRVELGYGFEKVAFGHTLTSPSDYFTVFSKYINQKNK